MATHTKTGWPKATATLGSLTLTDGYFVYVDWDGNGNFSDADENVSSLMLSVTIQRGFASLQDRVAVVGHCTLVLDNVSAGYSPYTNAQVLPRRQVKVVMVYGGVSATLFRGYVETIRPDAGVKSFRQLTLACVDAIALLQLHELTIGLQQDKRADEIVQAIVSDCYTPPTTAYDTDPDVYPFAADKWTDDQLYDTARQRALSALRDVGTSAWGRFFIRRDGAAVWESRHHRLLDTTSKAAFAGTMTGLDYQKGVGTVFNEVEVTAHPRAIGTANVVLWAFEGEAPAIQPGATQTFRARFRDPDNKDFKIGGKDTVTPAAYTDYTAKSEQGGGGDDLTGSVAVVVTAYANSADIAVTNNHTAVIYLTSTAHAGQGHLQVRGIPISIYAAPKFAKVDATSQGAYQKRSMSINAVLQDAPGEAEVQAQYLLDKYKNPLDDLGGVSFEAMQSAVFRAYARDLEIGDRITLTETFLGLSGLDVFINAIQHSITAGGRRHVVAVDVEKNEDITDAPFILDVSLLDTGVLVY